MGAKHTPEGIQTVARRGVRLKDASDVRRALARLYNGVMRDELGEGKARTLAYVCTVMLKAIEVSELSARLDYLEQRVREQGCNQS